MNYLLELVVFAYVANVLSLAHDNTTALNRGIKVSSDVAKIENLPTKENQISEANKKKEIVNPGSVSEYVDDVNAYLRDENKKTQNGNLNSDRKSKIDLKMSAVSHINTHDETKNPIEKNADTTQGRQQVRGQHLNEDESKKLKFSKDHLSFHDISYRSATKYSNVISDSHGPAPFDGNQENSFHKLPEGPQTRRRKRSLRQEPSLVSGNQTASPSDNLVCPEALSCNNSCRKSWRVWRKDVLTCFCDKNCLHFRDCCADFEHYCLSNVTENSRSKLNNSDNQLRKGMEQIEVPQEWGQWKCFASRNFKTVRGTQGIWMIGSCSPAWPRDDTSFQCKYRSDSRFQMTRQNYLNSLPVYSTNGTVYRNRYCAQCNGVCPSDLHTYGLSFGCDVAPLEQLNNKKKLDFMFNYCTRNMDWKPSTNNPRRYCLTLESSCSEKTPRDKTEKCINGKTGVVHIDGENFKNIHCGDCSGKKGAICGPAIPRLPPTGILPSIKPFSLIFNFGNNNQPPRASSTKTACPSKAPVYDHYLEVCRAGNIAPPRFSNFDEYRILLWLQAAAPIPPPNENAERNLRDRFKDLNFGVAFSKTFDINITLISNIAFRYVILNQYNLLFDIQLNFATVARSRKRRSAETRLNFNRVLDFDAPFNVSVNGTIFAVFKTTKRRLTCVRLKLYQRHEYTVLPDTKSAVYLNESSETIQSKDYYKNETSLQSNGLIFVCHSRLTANCSGVYVSMKETEFTMLTNRSILVNASKQIYDFSQYVYKNGTVWVCTNFSTTYVKAMQVKDDSILTAITFTGMIMSIVALSFVLMTYSLFSELRTKPGINLMNLSISILLAQLLWTVGGGQTQSLITCTSIAVLLHYFFLVSFIWTSIIAFDTWRAFSTRHRRALANSNRQKLIHSLRYMAVGWLLTMLYVGVCVALDQSKTVTIGYGSHVVCWIHHGMVTLYVFGIPVGLVLIFNTTFYVLTVKAIKATANQTRIVTEHSQTKRHFGIYVRIGAVMGFTWVFGFAAAFGWKPLWYPFVLLNTIQGVYIAVAFALSERARHLYKGLFARMKSSNRQADSMQLKQKGRIPIDTLESPLPSRNRSLDTRL